MILLSFDIEEFDLPLEYGRDITFEHQIAISSEGCNRILDILAKNKISGTFFTTATFAQHAPEILQRIKNEGHELASHSYYHSKFDVTDLLRSKQELERLSGMQVLGFRMPRMQPVCQKEVEKAGYEYNSSINPTFIPGRYNHFKSSRTFYQDQNVLQIPSTVTPYMRFPLFWLTFRNISLRLFTKMSKNTYKKDNYLNIYFHPWEFCERVADKSYGLPKFIIRNCGDKMVTRLDNYIIELKQAKLPFSTIGQWMKTFK
ncbi:polysaccharide deacetylase [Taibaiella sp. KBW10]|uniref:polysaccharide deacetylase family protein n=1 Tax=Taibaiella sp. KBW10 TaxID=2153357 RepID=UPI000F5B6841|nr:polysaccharide deacetylase family protein [Taibaiella sp. KBW10]RQO31386.1 polysaccharide deacetylase [Taibaiella sp. KBW10]